jgi:hypothetical protein
MGIGKDTGTLGQHAHTYNPGGKISGARLEGYDPENRIITIRVDERKVPEFWMHIRIPMDKLEAFIADQQREEEPIS